MEKELLTWPEISDAAASMFNIMGNNKEVGFAENVWQKLSELNLTSYSNNLELIKLKILFVAFSVLYKDFCNVVYDKHNIFKYGDLLKMINIDEFTLGRFYQEILKPKGHKLPDDFNSSKALEVLSKYFRKDIYQLLLKAFGSSFGLFISLWRAAYPYSDEDNLNDVKLFYFNLTPEKSRAYSWIENGCYVILDSETDY
ncbi:MAG: hypothetical protein IT276_08370 [Ignavibacteriaceae bacterium]|mgnify:CR=1 FL=1|nr:hypothetical protein [Ignavibacteriaceae bacterium]HMN24812.1 hypothetical protein [Ignavibacteriaceae bacterium]HRN26652.1 hypothetical protein [Ignavibacteriaceae bacterium]HRP94313.1 hypothetical protein [Ignavibacteriaceae bacterium]HRQ54356.1 hypothetical protein [Ignavibacteriaceae bacterium]